MKYETNIFIGDRYFTTFADLAAKCLFPLDHLREVFWGFDP